jgi:hypothetical protein
MSPEQATGQPVVVDHRTDIYSLGMTIYELLTRQPAFSTDHRQSLLTQIADNDPPDPRRINKSVPHELATIVLKAIAKHGGERYATAGEFAADLRRFVDDKPIHARRPSLLDRVTKWSRRHRKLVASAATLLVLVTIGSTIAAVCIDRALEAEKSEHARAEQNLNRAEQNLDIALKALDDVHLSLVADTASQQATLSESDRTIITGIVAPLRENRGLTPPARHAPLVTRHFWVLLAAALLGCGEGTYEKQFKERHDELKTAPRGYAKDHPRIAYLRRHVTCLPVSGCSAEKRNRDFIFVIQKQDDYG